MTSHPNVLGRTLPGHVGACLFKLQRGFNAVVYRWSSSAHNAYPAILAQQILGNWLSVLRLYTQTQPTHESE